MSWALNEYFCKEIVYLKIVAYKAYQLKQAIQLDPVFAKNIGQIVVLGGAFAVNGNVNPASEANVSC